MNLTSHIQTLIKTLLISTLTALCCNFSIAQTQNYGLKTVVIDAGHGGKDPGAIGKNAKEKDITLALALKTGKLIEDNFPDVKVIYTRKTDVFIELHKRAEIANKSNADLFISIHVNANNNTSANGTDTWVMGLAKSEANLKVARLENKVISMENDFSVKYEGMSDNNEEAIIIHRMMQSANLELSGTIASLVQEQFRERVGRKDRGVHQAPFLVLWKTTMPSILIETGFISNLNEESFLTTKQGQDYMSSAIFRAFRDFKELFDRTTNHSIDKESATSTSSTKPTPTQKVESLPKTEKQATAIDGITYSIQLASSKQIIKITPENFKGINNVYVFSDAGLNKYLAYKETRFSNIKELHTEVKKLYPNSFIVAIKNGKKINLQEAIKITQ